MFRFKMASSVILSCGLAASPAWAAPPVSADPNWALLREITFEGPMAPHFNPMDGFIYVGRADSSTDGLYRIDNADVVTLLSAGSNIAGVMIDPVDGDIFVSEHFGGEIFRTAFGGTGRTLWVNGFHSGDDDPAGMAIAPLDYSGSVLAPGEALMVDWGNSGADEIWAWSPAVAEGETAVHTDDGTLVLAFDVTITSTTVYVVDAAGVIYIVGVGGTLTPLVTSEPITDPMAIVHDPVTGDLLVLDGGAGRVVRIDPVTGNVSNFITGLVLDQSGLTQNWAALDISADGSQLVVSEHEEDRIWVFAFCDGLPDCNGNGIDDACDIAIGDAQDCNGNGIPDSCDIAVATSSDCDENGIPDECAVCPPVEIVFVFDTSNSMDAEGSALCNSIGSILNSLAGAGIDATSTIWGISETPGNYPCLTDHVINALGTAVPGNPPAGLETLGACPAGEQVPSEDWGLAVAVIAGNYPWAPDTLRLVIPLSDEGPWCGDPVNSLDNDAITHAIAVANANDVVVSPVTASGSSLDVIALAQQIADATGGNRFGSEEPDEDLAEGVLGIIMAACQSITDCNNNGTPDECDIEIGTSDDVNVNGIPDECECVGDLDLNGSVNVTDLLQLLAGWGPNPGHPADINTDGNVNVTDLLTLLGAWGACP